MAQQEGEREKCSDIFQASRPVALIYPTDSHFALVATLTGGPGIEIANITDDAATVIIR